jgi:hypothetical protein
MKLSPLILSEGRYDKIVTVLSREIVKAIKQKKQLEKSFSLFDDEPNYELSVVINYSTKIDYAFNIGGEYININKAKEQLAKIKRGEVTKTYPILVEVKIDVRTETIPNVLTVAIPMIKRTLRHEIEHCSQDVLKGKPTRGYEREKLSMFDYLTSPTEVSAMVQGFYKEAKSSKEYLDSILIKYLRVQGLSQSELKKVLTI